MRAYILIILSGLCWNALLKDIPIDLKQPDGSSLSAFASGDEYYVRLHNVDNYTIIQNTYDGYYYYAKLIENNITPTPFRADQPIPNSLSFDKGITITRSEYIKRRTNKSSFRGRDAPTIGTINNINIFIRFADENEFSTPRSIMDEPFNKPEGPSLAHYYDEVSYSLLEVNTYHYPICDMSTNLSYQDEFPRSYYQPYNAQTNPNGYTDDNSALREQTMLKNAIEFVSEEIPLDLDVDGDNDGYVDNVTFLISGSPDGWSDLLWPHRWSMYMHTVYINGAVVDAYNLNLASGGYFTVGTLCHEFFHSMGAPDLYHYYDGTAPISAGGWDVMDGSSNIPQYMGAWMKHKYGNWIDCPLISQMGIYPLLPLQNQETSCYRLNSPNSINEFFIVEYRNKSGLYEVNTPGNDSGMLIYRINATLNGNADGPPDEVYLYRPGGTSTENGNLTEAIFSAETGRTKFNDSTDPSSFLYGGELGGLNIQDIGYPEEIIEFTYWNIFVQTEIIDIINDNDEDGILNPGESANLIFSANILSAPSDAENVIGLLSSNLPWVHFNPSEINFNTLTNNGTPTNLVTQIILNNTESLMPATFNLSISADFDDNGETIEYSDSFDFSLDITLNQFGFPINTSEIRTNPLIIDWNNDGDKEIILGDYNGLIHIFSENGNEILNSTFPYDTGNQIWGSPASADIDRDGFQDIVINSKSKYLYIFDKNGLKLNYNSELYLIGTPAIGNLDNDEDLEIVFSGYSSGNKLFVINIDGTNVPNFPISIGEKVKAGVALADFNNNGKDDIVMGTDNDNLYLIYDDGSIAQGFPFIASDKFQSSPSILDLNGEKIIFAGNNDNNLYSINSDGSLRFLIETNDKINTSPAFINLNGTLHVLFGSKDNHIYMADMNGNIPTNWPVLLDGDIEGGLITANIDNYSNSEIISVTDAGSIYITNINGNSYTYFPIKNGIPFTGAPSIVDLDNDGDLEIIGGTLNNLTIIDIKELGSDTDNWSQYRNNTRRNGYFNSSQNSNCYASIGDLNNDSGWNILDVVILANCVLYENCTYIDNGCAGDINEDNGWNILDIVSLSNCIVTQTCNDL